LKVYGIGDRLSVVETPFGRVAVSICADNFPSSHAIGHVLGRMGARLILSPCAWAVDGNHDQVKDPYGGMWKASYAELAKLYDMSIVGVSNVGWMTGGPWKGRKCIGCSMTIGPCGTLLALGPYGDTAQTLMIVDIPIMPVPAKGTDFAPMLSAKGYEGG
jgi:predicted amidohydrolase